MLDSVVAGCKSTCFRALEISVGTDMISKT